jgi:hypothetical protein
LEDLIRFIGSGGASWKIGPNSLHHLGIRAPDWSRCRVVVGGLIARSVSRRGSLCRSPRLDLLEVFVAAEILSMLGVRTSDTWNFLFGFRSRSAITWYPGRKGRGIGILIRSIQSHDKIEIDCFFSWTRGGSIQSASRAKSPPKTLLAGPIAVKKIRNSARAHMRTEVVCPAANARPLPEG